MKKHRSNDVHRQIDSRDSSLDIVLRNKRNNKKTNMKEQRWYTIDTSMLPAKLCYFFDCAGKVSVNVTIALFLTQIGLDKRETGIILGIRFELVLFIIIE